jgi:hypothetical protein
MYSVPSMTSMSWKNSSQFPNETTSLFFTTPTTSIDLACFGMLLAASWLSMKEDALSDL